MYLIHNYGDCGAYGRITLLGQIYWKGRTVGLVALLLLERFKGLQRLYTSTSLSLSVWAMGFLPSLFYQKTMRQVRYLTQMKNSRGRNPIQVHWFLWAQAHIGKQSHSRSYKRHTDLTQVALMPYTHFQTTLGRSWPAEGRVLFFVMNWGWWDGYGISFRLRAMNRNALPAFKLWDCVNTFFLPLNRQ